MNSDQFSDGQLTGQRLMVGFDGTTLTRDLKYLIDTVRVGGIILFSRNIHDPEQLGKLCHSVQDHALICGQPPLFIAVDQEGGKVARLRSPFTEFKGNPGMRNETDAVSFSTITARELKEVGINMNMAPVMDVAFADVSSIMADRSFGEDPDWTARMGAVVIEQMQKNGIMAVAKHFPGIGRTTLDSHLDRPHLDTVPEKLMRADMVPFTAAIHHDVAGIMLSHVVYKKLDANWPASLSPPIAADLLRKKLGYNGVVLTDDLDMGAVKKYYPIETVVKQIMAADIDQALICHRSPDIEAAAEKMISILRDTPGMRKRAQASVKRILALKASYLEGA
ncbi:MAG: beta-N-acetylhexosaminidase [Thermodesulfobacteriota bacterium]|nr:beta-N-acetylhexosaminidase [Thermodesulfobacteriota bacterium]